MAGGKETPRQKMIGMMYLVLMAMLALNVTREVLNAFAVVNSGLTRTNQNFDQKNQSTYDLFKKALDQDNKKTKPFYDRAMEAQKLAKAFCAHIDSLKAHLLVEQDGETWDTAIKISLADVKAKEQYDKTTEILINDNAASDGSKGEAHHLKMMIADYRKKMLGLLMNPKDSNDVQVGLLTPDVFNKSAQEKQNWEIYNFYDSPLAACIVSLTRIQNEIKNAEASVIQKLLSSIDTKSYKFDKLNTVVLPKNNYVVMGDSFHAQIFLAASQSTQNPIVTIDSINGKAIPKENVKVSGGIGYYGDRPGAEGPVVFSGTIGIKDPATNKVVPYFFRSSYLAAKPSVVVSPTQMNVFYIGVPNPVSISAAGFADADLQPSFSGPGSMSGSRGNYVITLNPASAKQGTECSISVSGKMPDGSHKSLGQPSKFRIKRVPDPVCYVANKKGDASVTKGELSIATQVQARMENFDFNLNYAVTGFEMVVTVNGNTVQLESKSNLFTPQMKTLMNQVNRGSHIIIQQVHVHGPDTRVIPGVNISVN
jgi:gliding motility-associated protein GldM